MTALLLAGATGLVGGHVLARALAETRVTRLVAPTRRPLETHPKLLNPIIGDGVLPREAAWWAAEGTVVALGTTRAKAGSAAAFRAVDFDLALAVAELVRRRGATRFALTSSAGANPRSPFLYTRTKGELEEAVARLGFPSLTIVRPGLLGGERAEVRPAEQVVGVLLRALGPVVPRRYRISPAETVAAVLLEAALAGQEGHRIVEADELAD